MLLRTYLVGIIYIGVAALAIHRASAVGVPMEPHHGVPLVPAGGEGARGWFASVKPFCNSVEVETILRQSPPPAQAGFESRGYQAACLALAGRLERAREVIDGLDGDHRWKAAGIVFEVAHPVADAGDDRSAGPIMAMVVDYWPNHYMALYHAGASEYALGDHQRAREHLASFLLHYPTEDGWRASARQLLAELDR
jgi:hypothetical protein